MARRPKPPEDPAAVAEREMPGWKAVPSQPEAPPARELRSDNGSIKRDVDAVLPPMQQLRRKYLGAAAADAEPELEAALDSTDRAETEIVELESGEARKTVGVRNGKIVWRQG
jgi:hypothetical protein